MRFLPFCVIAVTATIVQVGTKCDHTHSCIEAHANDVIQFFKEFPGKYKHIRSFLDYTFISTSYYKISDEDQDASKELV